MSGGSDAYVAVEASSRDVGVAPTGDIYFAGRMESAWARL